MNSDYEIAVTTAVKLGCASAGKTVLAALEDRSNILSMTQQAEDAVLRPVESGAWPTALRISLAARIAALNGLPELARHYTDMDDSEQYRSLAMPEDDGSSSGLSHIVSYMDSVAVLPRDIKIDNIRVLQQEGVTDADIVRLTELNAFMSYQVRLVSALTLMSENTHE